MDIDRSTLGNPNRAANLFLDPDKMETTNTPIIAYDPILARHLGLAQTRNDKLPTNPVCYPHSRTSENNPHIRQRTMANTWREIYRTTLRRRSTVNIPEVAK
ncbi:Hypothetical predicted protein [Pelobates cultripes]|uniref:Uncharacterized protein n=1 Tax=Pelobates cultripes TaxID=61616 RepID=A0AAD1VJ88_PELCU|nr:Hypothetical predicted protein [Pelobates cultripes]